MDAAELSARQLQVFVSGLPDDAACWDVQGWGVDRELRAVTVELLDGVIKAVARSAGSKKRFTPLRIPRPHEVKKQAEKSTASKWVEFAKALRKG